MARLLIARGADVNLQQSRSILALAMSTVNLAMVELLLSSGANPNQISEGDPKTALMYLVSYGGNLSGKVLDSAQQRIASQTAEEMTAIAKRLVRAGADVNYASPICSTAYEIASTDHSEAMKSLLQTLGADPVLHLRCAEQRREVALKSVETPCK